MNNAATFTESETATIESYRRYVPMGNNESYIELRALEHSHPELGARLRAEYKRQQDSFDLWGNLGKR